MALFLALAAEVLHAFFPHTRFLEILTLGLALLAILLVGVSVYSKGIHSLVHGRINMHVLMAVAVTGACFLGQWGEAAMVMVLYSIAELIEARSVDKARSAIGQLLNLTPEVTERQSVNGKWESVPVKAVMPQEIIRVKPGDSVPLDGEIVSGFSAVNQMPITGESLSVTKVAGDKVYAGSINESGVLEIQVTQAAGNTMLARIISIVEKAQKAKAPIQRFVDRFAALYTPVVFLMAVAVAILMPILFNVTWLDSIYRALVLLVIACPCAFVIATPLTIVSGLTAAAKAGILIKGGIYLEVARKIKSIAFDKTGTITQGKPQLVVKKYFSKNISQKTLSSWMLTMTSYSSHPVSQAILKGISDGVVLESVKNLREVPGKGIEALIDDRRLRLGNVKWMHENNLFSLELDAFLKEHDQSGYTFTVLASSEEILAVFAVTDVIRPDSKKAIEALKDLKITPVMLTGDNTRTALAIASEAGIQQFKGDLLPEDKLLAIETFQKEYQCVGMVGDGINDAPALEVADIGIAMGGIGTGIAMETADVVIMNDDIVKVVDLLGLSRSTFMVLKQNMVLALGLKLLFFGLALLGYANMWMAVFADVGATLMVVFNGLRLLRWKSRF